MDPGSKTNWKYKPDGSTAAADPLASRPDSKSTKKTSRSPTEPISWTASAYIDHERGAGWYMLLAIATAGLAAGAYFLTDDYFSAAIIGIVGVAVGIIAARKPEQVRYEVSATGIHVGKKRYNYSQFRSFSLINEGGLSSLYLLPVKRFMVPITAYFDPAQAERIVNVIGEHLPYEEHGLDQLDRLTRRLRF